MKIQGLNTNGEGQIVTPREEILVITRDGFCFNSEGFGEREAVRDYYLEAGKFDNKLTGYALAKFNQTIVEMRNNCLRKSLLNCLDEKSNIRIEINPAKAKQASYDAKSNCIHFHSISHINVESLTAEAFHAYQNQYLNGKPAQIALDDAHNNIGGSNIEFEEKAMEMMTKTLSHGMIAYYGTEELHNWIINLLNNHSNYSNIELSDMEKQLWFAALEQFRQYYLESHQPNPFYIAPIDYNILPTTLLAVLMSSGYKPSDYHLI